MRALCWNGINDLRVETVLDPEIVNPHDAILQVTMSTTWASHSKLRPSGTWTRQCIRSLLAAVTSPRCPIIRFRFPGSCQKR